MIRPTSPVPLVRADAFGYTYEGQIVDGFSDRPELPLLARVRLARLAERYAPMTLCEAQRGLLASPDAERDAARQPSAVLDGFQANADDAELAWKEGIYAGLSPQEQQWTDDPGLHLSLSSRTRYPLTLSELHLVSGVDERELVRWTLEGLVPIHPAEDHRGYFSAGVARALRLARATRTVEDG